MSVVSTVFTARDKISAHFIKMGASADKFGKGAESAFKKASKSANRFQSVTKSILKASAIQRSFSLMTQGVQAVTTEFVSFDDAIFSASAKFKGLDLTTQKGVQTFKKLQDAARKTGSQTQFSAGQAGQALDFLALAGFNAEQAMSSLPGLADFATAANMDDFGRVVDIASDSLGAFGLMTKNAIQLQKNLTRVSDVFAKTQASTNTTIEDMFEAVKKGAPQFTSAGQSLETFTALLGVMANSGVKGAEAGTQLRNVMLRLADPTKKAGKQLRKLGVTTKDSKGNFRDAIDILADLEKGLKGAGTATKTQALATIFGARSVTGINVLLKEGTKSLRKWRKGTEAAGGTSKKIAAVMRQSLGNRLKALQSAAIEFGFKFLEAFKKNGVNGIDSLTEAIRTFNVQPIIDGVRTVIAIFSDLVTSVRSVLILSSPLIAAFVAYKLVIIGSAIATSGLTIATIKATVAQWALNAALAANPVGLIVAGVVALIAAIALVIIKWDVVKGAFISGGKAIFNVFSNIWKIVKKIVGGIGSFVFSSFLGKDTNVNQKSETINKTEGFSPPNTAEAKAQASAFTGVLRFENKPDNVSFKSKSIGAPALSIEGLGAN